MSYIDREKLMEVLHISDDCSNCLRSKYNGWCSEDSTFTWACECISDAPSADVESIRHGEWILVEAETGIEAFGFKEMTVAGHICSICGAGIGASEKYFCYCPFCGAHMDKGET